MTLAEAKDYINKNLPDRLKASDPMYKAGIVRALLFVVLDAAQGLIDALKTRFDVKLLNGLAINRSITVSPINMPAGSGDYRYLKIAQLFASNAGLYDILGLRLVMGSWGSLPRGVIEATFGNREGLRCQWTQTNDPASCGLVAYQNAAGVTTIYVKYINGFRSGSLSVTHNVQATVFEDFVEEVPSGTLVFDSFNLTAYPPTLLIDQNLTATRGYLRTGVSSRAFQLTGYKSGGSQTLNTGGYIEIKFDDGNVMKIPVYN